MHTHSSSLAGGLLFFSHLSSGFAVGSKDVVFIPTYFPYGNYPRIMTDIYYGLPTQKPGIPTVVDQGSANYWVDQKGAIINYGSQFLGQLGPCNITADPSYNYKASKTATKKVKQNAAYIYGGNGKIVSSHYTINDTMHFGNKAIQTSFRDTRVALANFTLIKQAANKDCKGKAHFQYDHSILGVSRFKNPSFKTVGPSFRQDLLDKGKIRSASMSMWFDRGPKKAKGTFYGTTLFGGVPAKKYKGPLVLVKPSPPKGAYVGYYVPAPAISVTGAKKNSKKTKLKTGKAKNCLVDSGTGLDNLAISQKAFEDAAGLITSEGYPAFNGSCDELARSGAKFSFTFPGLNNGKSVTIDIPLANYARGNGVIPGKHQDKCPLSLELDPGFSCVLAASFNTGAFFAVNDDKNEIALAQGGVSDGAKKGSKGLGKVTFLGPHDSLKAAGAV